MRQTEFQKWMMEERMAMAAVRPHAHVYINQTGDSILATIQDVARMWVNEACARWYAEQQRKSGV